MPVVRRERVRERRVRRLHHDLRQRLLLGGDVHHATERERVRRRRRRVHRVRPKPHGSLLVERSVRMRGWRGVRDGSALRRRSVRVRRDLVRERLLPERHVQRACDLDVRRRREHVHGV